MGNCTSSINEKKSKENPRLHHSINFNHNQITETKTFHKSLLGFPSSRRRHTTKINYLYSCSKDGKIIKWNYQTGEKEKELSMVGLSDIEMIMLVKKNRRYRGYLFAVNTSWKREGKFIFIWNRKGEFLKRLHVSNRMPFFASHVIFEIDSETFLVGDQGDLCIFCFENLKFLHRQTLHSSWLLSLVPINVKEKVFASSCLAGEIALFKIGSNNRIDVLQRIKQKGGSIFVIRYSKLHSSLVSGSYDFNELNIVVWRYEDKKKKFCRALSIGHDDSLYRGLTVFDDYIISGGCTSKHISIYSIITGDMVKTIHLKYECITFIGVVPDDSLQLIVGYIDGKMSLVNFTTGKEKEMFSFGGHSRMVNHIDFAVDEQTLFEQEKGIKSKHQFSDITIICKYEKKE